jgi:hypothetical protein
MVHSGNAQSFREVLQVNPFLFRYMLNPAVAVFVLPQATAGDRVGSVARLNAILGGGPLAPLLNDFRQFLNRGISPGLWLEALAGLSCPAQPECGVGSMMSSSRSSNRSSNFMIFTSWVLVRGSVTPVLMVNGADCR